MNIGYGKAIVNDKEMKCPICGKDIYVSKYHNDYACIDKKCPLGHGAMSLVIKIEDILKLI